MRTELSSSPLASSIIAFRPVRGPAFDRIVSTKDTWGVVNKWSIAESKRGKDGLKDFLQDLKLTYREKGKTESCTSVRN